MARRAGRRHRRKVVLGEVQRTERALGVIAAHVGVEEVTHVGAAERPQADSVAVCFRVCDDADPCAVTLALSRRLRACGFALVAIRHHGKSVIGYIVRWHGLDTSRWDANIAAMRPFA